MRRPTTVLLCFMACAASAGAAAQPAPAERAVLCVGSDGRNHLLRQRPDPAYHFFSSCSEAPAPAGWRDTPPAASLAPLVPVAVLARPARSPTAARAPMRSRSLSDKAERQSDVIARAASRHGLDRDYLTAIMHVESAFDPDAVSPVGATGLMQVMPATARRFGVTDPRTQLRDPEINVETGARYLSHLRVLFNDDWYLITAAYNAGEGAVRKYGNKVPPYNETQNYVRSVERRFDQYRLSAGGR
jgi:soluble lytic murein transglycosylase-like protein